MSAKDNKPPAPPDDALAHLQQEADALVARILLKLLANPHRQQKLVTLVRKILQEESGKGFWKRVYAGAALRLVPGFLNSLTRHIDTESPASDLGRLLTNRLMLKNRRAEEQSPTDKEARARRAVEGLDAFLAQLDFGELNEAVAGSHAQAVLLGEALAEILTDHHLGKLASLGPAAVAAANLGGDTLNRLLRHLHDVPPDFIAGFLAGLIDLLDADILSEFFQHKNELTRMLHIGDLLQGDGKTSALEAALTNKVRDVLGQLDAKTFGKKETGSAELKATVRKSLRQALTDHPEFLREIIVHRAATANTRLRSFRETLILLLDLPEEELAQNLATALTSLSTYDLSESFSAILNLVQTMHKHQPGELGKWLNGIVKTVDEEDLAAVAESLVQEAVEALRPLAAAVMPTVLQGLGDLLTASLEDAPESTAFTLSRLFAMGNSNGETK